jgi:hypothetical protein
MALSKGTRAGLLLVLTAGPFLVFLFLYLFGKNHFELDRYPLQLNEIFIGEKKVGPEGLLLMDTVSGSCLSADRTAQNRRLAVFWEDFGRQPEILRLNPADNKNINAKGLDWFTEKTSQRVKSARGELLKILPPPPRALLFDDAKTLRGVYGLCNDKSVDSLMLEYRILVSP